MKASSARTPILVSLLALSMLGVSSSARAQQQPFIPTVPIRIPAGTRGMQPNLALVYSPSGGNGLLGVGWTLTGIPSISRVNYGVGINFGTGGMPWRGTYYYTPDTYAHSEVGVLVPQFNGTYRSKKESFMLFQPFGTCGHVVPAPDDATPGGNTAPCSWTVTDRSGTKYFFGNTPNSRLMVPAPAGEVKIWALSRVQDLFGNSWSITYDQDVNNGQLYPAWITYTRGPGLTRFRAVEFSYDTTRPDTDHGYYSSRGYVQAMTRRLTGIQIKSAGVLLREYVLSYELGNSGRSRLRSITEKDAAGNALPEQVFNYEQGIPGFRAAPGGNSGWPGGRPATAIGETAVLLTGDFDADGKTDFAYVYRTPANTIGFRVQLSGLPSGSSEWAPPNAGPWPPTPLKQWGTFLTGDFDGDGRTDIAFVHSIADPANCNWSGTCDMGVIDVYQSIGFNFVKWQSQPCVFPGGSDWPLWGAWMTGDFDADGKTDIAFFGASSTRVNFAALCSWPNAEGIVPVVRVYGGGPGRLTGSRGRCTSLPYRGDAKHSWDPNWQQHATVLTGDFDGDGRTEIMLICDGGPRLGLNGPPTVQFMEIKLRGPPFEVPFADGSSWELEPWDPSHTWRPYPSDRLFSSNSFDEWKCGRSWQECGTFLSIDFNGDGKTDIAYLSQFFPDSTPAVVATDLYFSTGSGVERVPGPLTTEIWQRGRSWQDYGTFLKGDFNGDGKADLAYAWNNAGQVQIDVAFGRQSGGNLGGWVTWYSGTIPWPTNTGGASWQTVAAFQTGDFDGGGKMNISYAFLDLGSNAWTYVNLSNSLGNFDNPLLPDLMTRLNNGIGGTQQVDYVTAPNLPNAITPGNVTAPNVPNTSPQILVKSVQVSDGRIGNDGRIGIYTTNYSYENAQILPGTIDQQRNMGFQKIIATDAQTGQPGQSIETQYRQDVAGLEDQPSDVFVRNGAGQYMRHLHYGYEIVNPAEPYWVTATEFVETTGVEDKVFEHASSLSNPAYVRTTGYSYDAAGNIYSQRNTAMGLPTIDITTNYNPDFTNWLIGNVGIDQLKDRTVTSGGVQLQHTHYTWTNNNVTSISNWLDTENRSIVLSMSYDDVNGLLTSMTEPFDETERIPRTTITSYDDTFHAYPKVITDAKGFTTQRTYTAEGELATFIDQNNEITRYEYDGFGRKKKEIRSDGGTTVYNYNLTSNPNTQYTEIVTQVDTGNTISEKSYFDGTGFVYRSERTGDNGPICVFRQKDNAGRVNAISNPTFNCSHGGDAFTNIVYEAAGRPYTIKTPDGRITRYTYEANNSHFPCPNGRLEHVKDANGRETTHCIDSREQTVSVTDPLLQLTTYRYDAFGRPTTVSLPGGMSSIIRFDSLGRKTSLNDSQVGVSNYTYYDNGNLKSTTTSDAALTSYKTVTYSYDALNRATTKTVSDSQAGSEGPITFTYDESGHTDGIGRLTTVTGNNGLATQYSYTPLGQPKVVSRRIVNSWTGAMDKFTEAYTYDLGGRLTSLQYPDGSTANYYYTVGGNLQRVDLNGVTRAIWSNYDAFGAAGNVQYQNGVNTAYTFDDMHHLTGLVTTKSTFPWQNVLQNLTFNWYSTQTPTNGVVLGYIQENRQSTVINGVDTSETQTYWYDNLYRLTSASGVWGTRTYSYDANNNPTSFGGVTQRELSFSGTKLTAAEGSKGWSLSDIGYDTSGNMTNKTITSPGRTTMWQYKWTGENRLATATTHTETPQSKGPVTATTMLYDEAGQRFMKHRHGGGSATPDETTTYVGKTYEKWTSADPTTAPDKDTLHLFGNGQLIMSWTRQGSVQTAPGVGTFFYHRNHINSSAVITDINGAEVSRMVYLPFGELSQNNSTGADVVTDKYTGQVSDPETGLYYYNARYYDPMIGSFLSADPIVGSPLNAQSYNRYAYVRDNPVTNTDSTGLWCDQSSPTCDESTGIDFDQPSRTWSGPPSPGVPNYPSRPTRPNPLHQLYVFPGTPSTLQVGRSSSGDPNGTLSQQRGAFFGILGWTLPFRGTREIGLSQRFGTDLQTFFNTFGKFGDLSKSRFEFRRDLPSWAMANTTGAYTTQINIDWWNSPHTTNLERAGTIIHELVHQVQNRWLGDKAMYARELTERVQIGRGGPERYIFGTGADIRINPSNDPDYHAELMAIVNRSGGIYDVSPIDVRWSMEAIADAWRIYILWEMDPSLRTAYKNR